MAPVLNNQTVVSPAKLALMFWMSMMVIGTVPFTDLPDSLMHLVLALMIEWMIGAIFGFSAQLIMVGVELAGTLIDTQAGISAASLLDPAMGRQTTLISRLYREMTVLIFLLLNGHHALFMSIRSSFDLLPIAGGLPPDKVIVHIVNLGTMVFKIGLQVGAPLLIVIFLVDFAFGMLSRVAPQVNVFQLSFQLKPLVMVSVLMLVGPRLVSSVEQIIVVTADEFARLTHLIVR